MNKMFFGIGETNTFYDTGLDLSFFQAQYPDVVISFYLFMFIVKYS